MGVSACGGGGGSVSELADGSQNMKQCRGSVWWVRCTELQAGEQACWANYSLMGSFGRQLPGVNVVWRDEVRLKWNFWLENVFKWKGSRQLCADGVGGWLWADACCRTDHHPSMSTAHRRCCDWPLLFNIIPAHSFQDRFTSDSRRFLMLVEFRGNILKLSSFSEEFWQFQNDEKGNILTGHITTLKKKNRVDGVSAALQLWSVEEMFSKILLSHSCISPLLSCQIRWGWCAQWLIRWWW